MTKRNYTTSYLKRITGNDERIHASRTAVCYTCTSRFEAHAIKEFDDDGTASCPSCASQTVVGDEGTTITTQTLRRWHKDLMEQTK